MPLFAQLPFVELKGLLAGRIETDAGRLWVDGKKRLPTSVAALW